MSEIPSIPRDADGPVFPAPWTARAFALTVALEERGIFSWSEWSEVLGPAVSRSIEADATNPETYWRAWLTTLETILAQKRVASRADLADLQEAWREAAEVTPHGEPIELSALR